MTKNEKSELLKEAADIERELKIKFLSEYTTKKLIKRRQEISDILCGFEEPQESKEPLGLTPGEWYSNEIPGNNWIGSLDGDGFKIGCVHKMSDMKAICNAVNGTYGKGYDPAQTDALYKALHQLHHAVKFPSVPSYINVELAEAEQALKNAKL